MKIKTPFFRGEIPRTSSRLLPEGHAINATNARLVSGDLTAWKQPLAVSTLSPTSLKSIYKMQTLNMGNEIFLRSQNTVDWVRGPIAGDTTERIYFTGFPDNPGTPTTDKPKVTNFSKATGGTTHTGQTAGHYPNDWLLLGVPTPDTGLGAINEAISENTLFSDGSSTTMWTTTGTVAANNSRIDSSTLRLTHSASIRADLGVGNKVSDGLKFQFQVEENKNSFVIRFGCDSLGNGPAIKITAGGPGDASSNANFGSISYGTAPNWVTTPTYTTTEVFSYLLLGDTTQNVEISLLRDPPNEFSSDPLGDFKIEIRISGPTVFLTTRSIFFDDTVEDFTEQGFIEPRFRHGVLDRADRRRRTENRLEGSSQQLLSEEGQSIHTLFGVSPQGTYGGFFTAVGVTAPHDLYINDVYTMLVQPTDDAVDTVYVYTWVNEFGEEGPPSPPSVIVQKSNGLKTNLSGIADPTSQQRTDYGLSNTAFGTKRLYRAATAGDGSTNFFFVANIDYETTTYIDNITDSELGETLESVYWQAPPEDGHSIITLPNGITMLASKNEIFPSVQNRPHAYPPEYALACDFPIVGLAVLDATTFVLTQSNPYIVVGSDPRALSMGKIEFNQGCVSKRSIATLRGFGVIYASADGLVSISGNGAELITKNLFTREQWQALVPSSIFAIVHDDKYFFWYDTGSVQRGYIFDPREEYGLTPIDLSILVGYNNAITAAYSDPLTDFLYFIHSSNKLEKWNAHTTDSLQYTWRSKIYQLPYPAHFQAAQIRGSGFGSGVTFKLYADGSNYFTKTVTGQTEFVLPAVSGSDGPKEIQTELIGTATISGAEIAETMEEIA